MYYIGYWGPNIGQFTYKDVQTLTKKTGVAHQPLPQREAEIEGQTNRREWRLGCVIMKRCIVMERGGKSVCRDVR